MKKTFVFWLMATISLVFGQEQPKDLQFDTKFVDAENQYMVLPIKPGQSEFMVGVPYVDYAAGYSMKYIGDFKVENGKYIRIVNDEESSSNWIYRWDNLGLKVALLPKTRITELGLENPPSFLKEYQTVAPQEQMITEKASFMNGAGFSDLALPSLEKLNQENHKNGKFFFELIYAYNALQRFSDAEKIAEKAINNGFLNDLIRKEYLYALVNQKKMETAEKFLRANLEKYDDEDYKAESIFNYIAANNHYKNKSEAIEWLEIAKKQIVSSRFQKTIQQLEQFIQNND